MSDLFISQNSITQSYHALTQTQFKYGTEFFYFLLLKHAGISQHEFISLSDDNIKNKIIEATKKFSWLFLNEENFQDKKARFNFINPFMMENWNNQPSESIRSWAPARFVNNITGGGKQWKKILVTEDSDANSVKLRHDYMSFFEDMSIKYPLDAISIWLARFVRFDNEISQSSLNNEFYQYFNINNDEKSFFFSTQNNVTLEFSSEPTKSQYIRSLIGNPNQLGEWLENSKEVDLVGGEMDISNYIAFQNKNNDMVNSVKELDFYVSVLESAKQAILMGPPGTSKSFIASQLSSKFSKTKRLQFHPQYSYQDFIGGKILENGNLVDKKGEFILFLEEAMENPENSYLLVIEEINRANVSQVFGELIQLLDRGEKLSLTFNGESKIYELPKTLKIVGTMNTTDRTVGRIDYAIKRRFYQVYFGVDYNILVDKVSLLNNEFSIADLLQRVNTSLLASLNNKEMIIGHAIFLKDFTKNDELDKYMWNINDFSNLFNYVILPIIEDYCNGNIELIMNIMGEKLMSQLTGDEFVQAIQEYLTK